ncbi:hypothetical protein KIW84_073690 [Lathyrus oleraceus]|uniref:Uncharacterized protein n=1 Tax=Pisum sativum TaxID=3888 RepID=A0A9D4VQR6_PEA|nr:hypothetical protein KIW84_073690 [Pisum sativum]
MIDESSPLKISISAGAAIPISTGIYKNPPTPRSPSGSDVSESSVPIVNSSHIYRVVPTITVAALPLVETITASSSKSNNPPTSLSLSLPGIDSSSEDSIRVTKLVTGLPQPPPPPFYFLRRLSCRTRPRQQTQAVLACSHSSVLMCLRQVLKVWIDANWTLQVWLEFRTCLLQVHRLHQFCNQFLAASSVQSVHLLAVVLVCYTMQELMELLYDIDAWLQPVVISQAGLSLCYSGLLINVWNAWRKVDRNIS